MTDQSTADAQGARAHARAMAGTRVEAMPTVPPAGADNLPAEATPDTMLWEETVAPGGYASKELHRGARLRLTDLQGDACASMLVFNSNQAIERLNVADSVRVQWNASLQAGRLLLSDMGRVLMTLIEDEAQTHDTFC